MRYIRKFLKKIKMWFVYRQQRKKYGCTDEDIYSLDYSFYKWAVPRIKYYRDSLCGLPSKFVYEVEQKYRKKGYKYDTTRHRFESKQIRNKVWKEAMANWVNILNEILVGFEDALLEENDFDAWRNKYKKQIDKANKQLSKCITTEEKENLWKHYCPLYYELVGCGLKFHEDAFSFELRRKSRDLFAEYLPHMWL